MNTVTVTINGQNVSGQEGMTLLDLAREAGIRIPTLCYDPHLGPYGSCRVCLVEDNKSGALLASCVTPISAGMVISTDSPRVLETRKIVVQLMLASHPESCLLCDKGNLCQLRQIAAELGIGALELYKLPNYTGTQEVNPFIRRDLSKCILCGKCIRADQELVVEGAIDYLHRGFDAKPATLEDQPLERSECTFCGTCVTLCPTGALSEKEPLWRGTASQRISSVCPYCACGCSLLLGASEGKVVGVKPGEKPGSVNSLTLCVKGHYGWDFIHSPERLQSPLIRKNGNLVVCSWEEALDFVVRGLKGIQGQHGSDFLAFLGSSKCTNEENYLFQKLARVGLGTNNVDHGSPLTNLPSPEYFGPEWGWGSMTAPIGEIEKAKGILVIGANPEETAPIVAYKIKRAVRFKGASLILVDPRKTKLVPFSKVWLEPRWGRDWALILGLLRAILDEGLGDRDWIQKNVAGLEALVEEMKPFNLDWAAGESGIGKEVIRDCARILAASQPAAIIMGSGLWQGPRGISALSALMNLALLIGARDRFYPLGKESNGQGARDMGVLPDFLPGYQNLDDGEARRKFEEAWGQPLPRQKGLDAGEMIMGAEKGRIRGMYILGENPVRSFPGGSSVRETLAKLDFLVVQDLFLTETAHLAQAILPACSFAEKEGTMTSAERRVQLLKPAGQPTGLSLPDVKILVEIAQRMGIAGKGFSSREIWKEINGLVPLYGGISPERLDREDLSWPCRNMNEPGFPFLSVPGEKLKFWGLLQPGSKGEREANGRFRLLFGSSLYHAGSGSRSSRSARLSHLVHPGILKISPGDASQLGMEEGCRVKVTSGEREMTFSLSLDSGLPPGLIFLPVSSIMQGSIFDLLAFPREGPRGFPNPKTVEVRIERVEA